MSFLLVLKNYVPQLLRKMDRPFKVSVAAQKKYLSAIPEPQDKVERSYAQYKCQILFWGRRFHFFASAAALFLLPIQVLNILCKKPPRAGESVELLLLSQDMPDNIYPKELLDDFLSKRQASFFEGYFFPHEDWRFFFRLVKQYPLSPYFLYKCLVKMAIYSYQIHKNHPKAIATCGGEFTYTSSLLTAFCERYGIAHYNVMHGEMFYYILDAFCSFHKFYIWDEHYQELLTDLRASAAEFMIAPPASVKMDLEKVDIRGLKIYDFKYCLQLQDAGHMEAIASILAQLQKKGSAICLRYHPRSPNIAAIHHIFRAFDIEDPRKVGIAQSIKSAKRVIALNSTVLYQAFMSGVPVVIDDMTDIKKYELLGEMRYIMLSKKHDLLSQYVDA